MPSPHKPQDFACRDRDDGDRYTAFHQGTPQDTRLDVGIPYDRRSVVFAVDQCGNLIDWAEVRQRTRVHAAARELFFPHQKGTPNNG